MSHPDLGRILAGLDSEDAEAIKHLLTCPDCASMARESLGNSLVPEPLPARDLAALESFQEDLARQREKVGRFIRRLKRKKGSPVHYLVCSRLECVMADRLDPAVRELEAIAGVGRGGFEVGEGVGEGNLVEKKPARRKTSS
jgi:hypothetical protein